ncbi:MAG TPA: VOC family protein [Aliidongia sp.]|uniref:VOC family protein n=1 Tax=Aliidongia sp. TaxID=1914230 RepID=UPI002DDD1FAE|nr:VOC family protein [Aliidongia sp.]HEV2678593.1 VOC family protein [Aliidongia sp.]
MARVLGVGGIFFKSRDPAALGSWYARHLRLPVTPPHGASLHPERMPPGGFTIWAPFRDDTDHFEPSGRDFMINLVVDDLDQALEQVAAGGGTLVGGIETYDYGRFGWFLDPEGNKVELWQPLTPSVAAS